MDKNLLISLIGLFTLIFGTILASIVATWGIGQMLPELGAFVVSAFIALGIAKASHLNFRN
ncbi:hypothetical protein [Lentilactobacillus sp. SPB1-3]|uniref:Uncharacterized protein n=1 Tax=Lentilactobacillus terminaliae TaxID=3003483 RepID=A0ACD5DE35_9LACO|nr:hypothetical protein [Lentilactobacillus sp. SPB1-3]MCZ0977549.1 hypothetical protein [Lentilactobacillus sp. SPB1-3]